VVVLFGVVAITILALIIRHQPNVAARSQLELAVK
jgi:hypothetical protein